MTTSKTISNDVWKKLSKNKKYREEFVTALVKQAFPLQVRTIRKKRRMSQGLLAEEAGVTQGVVSRAEDPNYGNLTFNTALRIVAGFDLAFIPKIVTFKEFMKWVEEVAEGYTDLPSFEKEAGITQAALGKIEEDLEKLRQRASSELGSLTALPPMPERLGSLRGTACNL